MKRHLYIVLFLLILFMTGCLSPVKQGWNNFTAYYNTFYNAKQAFDEGLELNERQMPETDMSRPVRIHPSPSDAGHDEFDEAIEKGASILRDHSESSYVTDALYLIGRSYFYRQEYFSALEKFQELAQIASNEELQDAVIWQGRSYLEMELYEEGIRVLNREIDFIEEWDPAKLAETRTVLAQLYVGNNEWDNASAELHASTGQLKSNRLQARAYLLHGQVQEELGNNFQALAAYRLASGMISEYDIEFNSRRKLAEMYRKTGDYEAALRNYRALERDDKYLEDHVELRYEIARTYQQMNEADEAITRYNNLLRDRFNTPANSVKAKTYYGLAEIYRNRLNDFQMAAAYYDSANSLRSTLPDANGDESEDVDEIARSFGEYASLKQEIAHIDSLLYLGTLSPTELDSVIQIIQEEREAVADEGQTQYLVNENDLDEPEDAAESVEFGFLNINDPVRLEQASLTFKAVWGDRPLVDNWRRQSSILVSVLDEDGSDSDNVQQEAADGNPMAENETESTAGVDVSGIPFTETERLQAEEKKMQLEYQLGNLFFLSLNMPDSARIYFDKVIENTSDDDLQARTLYTVAELELEYGNRRTANPYADRLFEEYPNSSYTERLQARMNPAFENIRQSESGDRVLDQYYSMKQEMPDTSFVERAEFLVELAESTDDPERKALFFLEAVENYMKAARQESGDDSTIDPQNDQVVNARELLSQIIELSPSGRHLQRAERLLNMLDELAAEEEDVIVIEQFPPDRYPSDPAGELPFCSDAGVYLDLPGGAVRVIDEMNWSEEERAELPAEIIYRFAIEPDGTIKDFSLLEPEVPEAVKQDLNDAIRGLSFEPVGGEHSIRCRISFPVRQ